MKGNKKHGRDHKRQIGLRGKAGRDETTGRTRQTERKMRQTETDRVLCPDCSFSLCLPVQSDPDEASIPGGVVGARLRGGGEGKKEREGVSTCDGEGE